MAKYLITADFPMADGRLITADVRNPAILTLPDDHPPSRRWKALDAAASKALEKYKAELKAKTFVDDRGNTRPVCDRSVIDAIDTKIVGAPGEKKDSDQQALSEMNASGKGKRASDKDVA